MLIDEIRTELFSLSDEKYRDFQKMLVPTLEPEVFVGVRTPQLRKLAGKYANDPRIRQFLIDLPHRYFDENQLHAFVISRDKNFDSCVMSVSEFLPFVDNWATCDQMNPKVFAKHKPVLLQFISDWLSADKTYTVRFAIKMLMDHFLDDSFDPQLLTQVAKLRSDEYYVKMMQAWYFATALAKQYDIALERIISKTLDPWTHNKAIQKAIESRRITDEQKRYLKTLKV